MQNNEVSQLLEHLFRHKSGQIVAVLTRIFGMAHLQLAEDVVQDTLAKALQQWPFRGVPDNPGGWLLQVAKNRALDILRRETVFRTKAPQIAQQIENQLGGAAEGSTSEFEDEQLTLMFTCCHPAFTQDVAVALILKTLCGFGVPEIARAFLTQEATIAQRLVRAKKRIREESIRFEIPEGAQQQSRLRIVMEALYLMFNEGYAASEGDRLIRRDLCEEAVRLTDLLVRHPAGNQPEIHALLALMLLQSSRLDARTDAEGNLLVLAEQDRSRWNQNLIAAGLRHLTLSAAGQNLTAYHLQAGIASFHATAQSNETTNWQQILSYYDSLIDLSPSPVWKLNRAVALGEVHGAEAALHELQNLSEIPALQSYFLFHATCGELLHRLGRNEEASAAYRKALELAGTEPERRFLQKKLL